MTKKQLLEEFTEGLEILFLKRGRGSKIYSSDLDRTLKFFTQSINRVEKAERARIIKRAEKILQEERFSGTPYALNKLIAEIQISQK